MATMQAFVMKETGEVGFMDKRRPEDPGADGASIETIRALICTLAPFPTSVITAETVVSRFRAMNWASG